MNAQSAKKLLTSYAWITVGSLLYALAFDWFYAPNQIALGGITGLGQAIHTYIPFLSVGLFVLLVNTPCFCWGGGSSADICWPPPYTPWPCPRWPWTG